jgi:putative membrane protein
MRPASPADEARVRAERSANERTCYAWIRTGLALVGLGFVIARFGYYLRQIARASGFVVPHGQATTPIGLAHMVAGLALIVVAVARFLLSDRARRQQRPDARALSHGLVLLLTAGSLVGGIGLAIDLLLSWPR